MPLFQSNAPSPRFDQKAKIESARAYLSTSHELQDKMNAIVLIELFELFDHVWMVQLCQNVDLVLQGHFIVRIESRPTQKS